SSQVVLTTSDGGMTVNLDDSDAPQTVANFLDYINDGDYDATIFQRLDFGNEVLQGGSFDDDPSASGFTSVPAGPDLQNEAVSGVDTQSNVLGTLGMANSSSNVGGTITNANTATSGFYFNLANNSSGFNGQFAVFGSVASDAASQATFTALHTTG